MTIMMNGHTESKFGGNRFAPTNRFATNRFGATTTAERAGTPRVGAAACAGGTCNKCKDGKTAQPAPAPAPPRVAAPPPPVAYVTPPVGAGQMRTMGAGSALVDAVWTSRSR